MPKIKITKDCHIEGRLMKKGETIDVPKHEQARRVFTGFDAVRLVEKGYADWVGPKPVERAMAEPDGERR